MNVDLYIMLQFETQSAKPESRIDLQRTLSFKIIFINFGKGIRCVNQTSFNFKEGDLFLVVPGEKVHYLQTAVATQLSVIKFTSLLISDVRLNNADRSNLLTLLQYANHTPDYMLLLRTKAELIRQLLETIFADTSNSHLYTCEYIKQLFYAVIFLIGEKVKALLPKSINHQSDQRIVAILHYIHLNIFNPEKLSTIELARKFFMSPVYIGRYFKKNTGENLHQYILGYKIRLIENRLSNSAMRISEIAEEFGFVDKSYMNKFFVKFKGMSPIAYRKCTKADCLIPTTLV